MLRAHLVLISTLVSSPFLPFPFLDFAEALIVRCERKFIPHNRRAAVCHSVVASGDSTCGFRLIRIESNQKEPSCSSFPLLMFQVRILKLASLTIVTLFNHPSIDITSTHSTHKSP